MRAAGRCHERGVNRATGSTCSTDGYNLVVKENGKNHPVATRTSRRCTSRNSSIGVYGDEYDSNADDPRCYDINEVILHE
jgi:hypothetical protein